ncbi:MAG: hypothetical protein ACLU6W_05395 [Lachnospiraceae bacterium]
MLKKTKKITLEGGSYTAEGEEVMHFRAELSTENPAKEPDYTFYVARMDLYRENRETCSTDQDAFEEAMYQELDEIQTEPEGLSERVAAVERQLIKEE